MAIHGIHIKGSANDVVNSAYNPAFLQVNRVSLAIENTIDGSGSTVYPYAAWTQFSSAESLDTFKANDNYASGWEIEGVAGETVSAGQILYRNSNTRWKKARADGATPAEGINMIGFCMTNGNTNDSIKILLFGFASFSSSNFNHQASSGDSWNGVPLYLDATTYGYMTDVAPSGSGNIVRTMGFLYNNTFGTAGASGNLVVYFNPDRTFLIV